jgi:ABC-type transporter Mla subunit MlaD
MSRKREDERLAESRAVKRSDQTILDNPRTKEASGEKYSKLGRAPTMSEREAAAGLSNTTRDEGLADSIRREFDEKLRMPTMSEREAAAGLTNTVSEDRNFYSFNNGGTEQQFASEGTDVGVYDAPPPSNFTQDPPMNIPPRTRIWQVNFGDFLNIDPFTLGSKALEQISGSLLSSIPSESQIKSIIDQIFASLTRTSSDPSSIASSLEALFNPLQSIVDQLTSTIETLLDQGDSVRSSIENGLASVRRFPRSGDFIYTPEFGNVYNVFETAPYQADDANLISENLIFRVKFTVNIDNRSKDYVAVSLLPVPDISALLKTVLKLFIDTVSKTIGNAISGGSRAAFGGITGGLQAVYDELVDLLEALEDIVDALSASLSSLYGTVGALSSVVASNTARITAIEATIATIQTEITAIEAQIAIIEAQLAAATDVEVIAADGTYTTMSVLENTPSATTARRQIKYLESDTGQGYAEHYLVAKNEAAKVAINTVEVDYRQVDYIHPNGQTFQIMPLVRIDGVYTSQNGYINPSPLGANYTKTSVAICENGTTTTKDILTTTSTP